MTINEILAQEIETRIIECGIHRILRCIDKLTIDQIRYRPNENSNSINNQILHLNGNVRQWLIATMSEAKDNRKRESEFDHENNKTRENLILTLRTLENDIHKTIPLITNIDLTARQQVQCYTETNLAIIIHTIEHFSYHVGQITYITKMILDVDTGYYAGQSLDQIN